MDSQMTVQLETGFHQFTLVHATSAMSFRFSFRVVGGVTQAPVDITYSTHAAARQDERFVRTPARIFSFMHETSTEHTLPDARLIWAALDEEGWRLQLQP